MEKRVGHYHHPSMSYKAKQSATMQTMQAQPCRAFCVSLLLFLPFSTAFLPSSPLFSAFHPDTHLKSERQELRSISAPRVTTRGRLPVLRATLTGRDKIAEQDVTSSLQQEMAKLRSNCGDKELAALNALFVRSPDELASIKVPLPSALPADLPAGALLRVGPNARPGDPIPGFFDGDGMVNAVVIPPGDQGKGSDHVFFGRKWVRTRAFKIEEEKQILFEGIMCAPRGWPIMKGLLSNFIRTGYPLKDTANTAISFHAGGTLCPLLARLSCLTLMRLSYLALA
eukprot:762852-Hanusia_phi.AAC.7